MGYPDILMVKSGNKGKSPDAGKIKTMEDIYMVIIGIITII